MGISEVMYSYGLCIFSIVLIFLLAYLQLKINKSSVRQWCILVLACGLITNVSIMLQIVSVTNQSLGIWYEAFSLIGITFLPICWFFAVSFFVEEDFSFNKKQLLLFVIPIVVIIATFTNNFHHLMFKQFSVNLKDREYGILFYIMLAYLFLSYLLTTIAILKYLSKNKKKNKNQIFLSIGFILIPTIFLILSNFKFVNLKSYSNGIFQSLISISAIEILLNYQILTEIMFSISNVLNIITDGFIVVDKKGNIIAYNDVFIKIFNLGKLDIQRLNIMDLIDFREFDTLNEKDFQKITSLTDYNKSVTFERTSQFLKLTLKYDGTPLLNKNNNKLFLISVVDITGYSKDIQNIQLNKDALLSRERLASLGQMIGGIAHNLKTPIFSIAGAIEGIEDLVKEYRDSITDSTVTIDDHKEIAKDIYNWTEKIQGYLSYMTDIIIAIQMQTSTGNSDITEEFTIKELIKYINILMKYELKQNLIDLEINIRINEDKKIIGNINNLVQVLNNLISNSIQAYSKLDKDKIIRLNIYDTQKDIIFEVQDCAGGIPENVKNKLFKEMVTTKGKNGTGLGLFISYTSIKTGFGGNLCFTTKEGEGTIFKVIIPKERKI